MPIRRFLNGEKFDQETTRVLGVAFELTCIALRVGDCENDVKQAIADKIIALAKKSGERNPDILCEQVVNNIRSLGIAAATAPPEIAVQSSPPILTE
jgi:hypothetical protein